jgi:hypothetical protein
MNDRTKQNLENRNATIKAQLGVLAYQRREHQLATENIDKRVAAMEAQGVVIEATLNDLNFDEARANEQALKERADAKTKRSKVAKAAAKKKKKAGK